MSILSRAPFVLAALAASLATVNAATPAFAAGEALTVIAVKSGGISGARRYCLATQRARSAPICRTARGWALRGVTVRER